MREAASYSDRVVFLGDGRVVDELHQPTTESVLDHLIKGGDLSRFGLYNAVTRTAEELTELFGAEVAQLVDGVTKLSKFSASATLSQEEKQAENFRKMIIAMAQDIRVILVKLADRLHNMRTMDSMKMEKQLKIASETIYVYSPLAHRMGLYNIKTEMEDLAMKYLEQAKKHLIYQILRLRLPVRSDARAVHLAEGLDQHVGRGLDVAHRAVHLGGRGRVVVQVPLGHPHGPDVERPTHPDVPVSVAEDELGRAAADVDDQHRAGDAVADPAHGTVEGEAGLLLTRQHLGRDAWPVVGDHALDANAQVVEIGHRLAQEG